MVIITPCLWWAYKQPERCRRTACMGGLLSVLDGDVRLVATTWEWAEDID